MKGHTYSDRFGRQAPTPKANDPHSQQARALMRPYFANTHGKPRHWRESPHTPGLARKLNNRLPRGKVAQRLEALDILSQDNTIEENVLFDGEPWKE